jgi:hypothetical protein
MYQEPVNNSTTINFTSTPQNMKSDGDVSDDGIQ